MDPAIVETKIIHEGWGRFLLVRLRLPDGQILTREIEDHGSAVVVLPYDPVRRMAVLVRQLRAPVLLTTSETEVLEAIAGGLETEDTADCARREAMEEAGLALSALEPVATAWTMPGISTERLALYLATYSEADRIGDGGGLADEHENITVEEVPLSELAAMADRGALNDLKTLALLQTLRLRRPELFI
jgi:nudix-type nucleoside diphosphatase (YffH/AdpP family)